MLTDEVINSYDMTIGIECHVQLATKTKLFSDADNDSRDKTPNSTVSPIDFGLPGMLPVLNHDAIRLAVIAGKALRSDIAHESRFDRKHYFYPDLPKGYQTTQMFQPIIGRGEVELPNETKTKVRIHHAHLEEDAGKLTHYSDYSLVDLNRAGTPLVEIVSEPDIHSAYDAKLFAQELYLLMTYAGVTRGDLYHGNMRFDVNISVAKKGASKLGTRAEVKNLNSFRSVEKAAEYEFKRQIEVLESGERIIQETRGWNEAKQKTLSQRSKEDAQDYRYMPDADIPPVRLTSEEIFDIQATTPTLPPEYCMLWQPLSVDSSVVDALLARQESAVLVTNIMQQSNTDTARRVAHWLASAVTASYDDTEAAQQIDIENVSTQELIELANMVTANELSSTAAKDLFNELLRQKDVSVRELAESRNLLQVTDEDAIDTFVDEVLSDPASQKAIADIRAGNDKAYGFLVGQVMKRSKSKANPAMAQAILRSKIKGE